MLFSGATPVLRLVSHSAIHTHIVWMTKTAFSEPNQRVIYVKGPRVLLVE